MEAICPFNIFAGELFKILGCLLAFTSIPQVSVTHFWLVSGHIIVSVTLKLPDPDKRNDSRETITFHLN